jgi:hypothetical protein
MARPSGRGRQLQVTQQIEQRQAEQSKQSRTKGFIIGGVALAAVGALVAAIALSPPPPGVEFPSQGNAHLSSVSDPHPAYNSSPPSSGWHFGGLAPWTEHTEAVPPELWLHNLEDAGIVLAYSCPEGCDDLVEGIRQVVEDNRGKALLVTPYEGPMVNPVDGQSYRGAAVAWTRILYFDELDSEMLKELRTFIDLFEGIDHHVGN